MELTPAVAAIFGGLAGAVISSVLTIFGQWLSRRSDERRHLLDLCFKTAVTNWERDTEIAKAKANANGQRVAISPLDLYIIHMLSLAKLSGFSQDKMLIEWARIANRTRLAFEAAKDKQPS